MNEITPEQMQKASIRLQLSSTKSDIKKTYKHFYKTGPLFSLNGFVPKIFFHKMVFILACHGLNFVIFK